MLGMHELEGSGAVAGLMESLHNPKESNHCPFGNELVGYASATCSNVNLHSHPSAMLEGMLEGMLEAAPSELSMCAVLRLALQPIIHTDESM